MPIGISSNRPRAAAPASRSRGYHCSGVAILRPSASGLTAVVWVVPVVAAAAEDSAAAAELPEAAERVVLAEPLGQAEGAAVEAVLAAAGLHGGGDRLAGLGRVGGDYRLEPEQAAVLGALGGAHLGAVERRGQSSFGQPPAFLAHELVLLAAVQASSVALRRCAASTAACWRST